MFFSIRAPEGRHISILEEVRRGCDPELILPPAQRSKGLIASILPLGRPKGILYVGADERAGGSTELLSAALDTALVEYQEATPEAKVVGWETAVTGTGVTVPVAIFQYGRGVRREHRTRTLKRLPSLGRRRSW